MSRFLRKKQGFTLIESMLTIVIISIGLFGLMALYHNSARSIIDGDINLMSTYLAQERIEQLVSDKVAYGYAYVINTNYTTTESIVLGNNLFTRSFNIYEVDKSDLITPLDDSGFKRIDMTVTWGTAADQNIVISTILTNY